MLARLIGKGTCGASIAGHSWFNGAVAMNSSGAPMSRPEIDPTLGDPTLRALRDRLDAGDWRSVHEYLVGLADRDLRAVYVQVLSDGAGEPAWLAPWMAEMPHFAIPWLMRAAQRIHWAWEARGPGRAGQVTEEGWTLFRGRLKLADRDLSRAAFIDRQDPSPYGFMLIVAMGQTYEMAERELRRLRMRERGQLFAFGEFAMLDALNPKWGGTPDQMFDHARGVAAAAPDGHPLIGLIPRAHVEHWLVQSWENNTSHFYDMAVREEVHAAAARCLVAPALGIWETEVLNWFAYAFALMEDWESAQQIFTMLGGRARRTPWGYTGDPLVRFAEAQQTAFSPPAPAYT